MQVYYPSEMLITQKVLVRISQYVSENVIGMISEPFFEKCIGYGTEYFSENGLFLE